MRILVFGFKILLLYYNYPIPSKIISMENLETDFERAQYLQNLLINFATGGQAENSEYQELDQSGLDVVVLEAK